MRTRGAAQKASLGATVLGLTIACSLASGASVSARPASYSPPTCSPVAYRSAPELQAQRVCMNVGVSTHGTEPGTYLFVSPGGKSGTGAGIFRDDGTLVWWQHATGSGESNISVVSYRGVSYLAIWSGSRTFQDPDGMGTISLYNEHYQRVGQITAGRPFTPDRIDAHEFRITPQGDALFGIYDPVSIRFHGQRIEAYQYVVQKVSLVHDSTGIHTGRVLFQWQSIKHIPPSQSKVPAPTNHRIWDYFHGNAISQDTDGNLLVSGRNTWGIYKINAHTGQIIWQVGASGDSTLHLPWAWQHDIVPLGQNRYSLFDDGARQADCRHPSEHPSRGLIVEVDPSQGPAGLRLLAAYSHSPSICSGFCGSMQLVPGGDVLISWGDIPEITEYRPDGGGPEMDLTMSNWSSRGYRFPWRGYPLTKPALAARSLGTGTQAWASWNGSTEVAAWQVLGGSGSSHLRPVGSPVAEQGFETEIVLPQAYSTVAVQALGASGQVLSTSRPVSTGGSNT